MKNESTEIHELSLEELEEVAGGDPIVSTAGTVTKVGASIVGGIVGLANGLLNTILPDPWR